MTEINKNRHLETRYPSIATCQRLFMDNHSDLRWKTMRCLKSCDITIPFELKINEIGNFEEVGSKKGACWDDLIVYKPFSKKVGSAILYMELQTRNRITTVFKLDYTLVEYWFRRWNTQICCENANGKNGWNSEFQYLRFQGFELVFAEVKHPLINFHYCRETKLCITFVRSQAASGNTNYEKTVLGCTNLNLFNYDGTLKQGRMYLKLWPPSFNKDANPLGTIIQNPDPK